MNILFNSQGFRHLRYDGTGKERSLKEQTHRLNLLPFVIPIICKTQKIDEYRREIIFNNKIIEYWAFKENLSMKNQVIIVVLKRINTGNIIFQSVMSGRTKKPSL